MSLIDKLTGRAKKAAGDLAGDPSLRREGSREERKGEKKEELDRAESRVEEKAREVGVLDKEGTLVLETRIRDANRQARLIDCFTIVEPEDRPGHWRELVRIVEGESGAFDFRVTIVPRFDYGAVDPWIRHHGAGLHSAIGG